MTGLAIAKRPVQRPASPTHTCDIPCAASAERAFDLLVLSRAACPASGCRSLRDTCRCRRSRRARRPCRCPSAGCSAPSLSTSPDRSMSSGRGRIADRRFLRSSAAFAAVDHPAQHAQVVAEPRPQELAILVLAEPVHVEHLAAGASRGPRSSASATSSRRSCSRRTASSPSSRDARRPPGPSAAAVVSDAMPAPIMTPCVQSRAS